MAIVLSRNYVAVVEAKDSATSQAEDSRAHKETTLQTIQEVLWAAQSNIQTVKKSYLSRWVVSPSNRSPKVLGIFIGLQLPTDPSRTRRMSARLLRTLSKDLNLAMEVACITPWTSMILTTMDIKDNRTNNRVICSQDRDHRQPNISQSTTHKVWKESHQKRRMILSLDTRIFKMSGLSLNSWRGMDQMDEN